MHPSGQPALGQWQHQIHHCRQGQFLFRSSRFPTPSPDSLPPILPPPQHPHSRSSSDVILVNPSTPKLTPGSPPQLPEPAGWVGQPRYQRVKPLLPPPCPPNQASSPPASCRLPASSQVLIPAGGGSGQRQAAVWTQGATAGGLPTPQHPALPDGGSHPHARGSVLGGLGRQPAPPRLGAGGRLEAQTRYRSPRSFLRVQPADAPPASRALGEEEQPGSGCPWSPPPS